MKLKVPLTLSCFLLITLPLFAQWTQIGKASRGFIRELDFPTPQTGYATSSVSGSVTPDSLLKTTDGGQTWNMVLSVAGVSPAFHDISFPHQDTGVVTMASPTTRLEVLRTVDGGQNWDTITPGFTHQIWHRGKIHFTDGHTGYLANRHYIFKTTNGGQSWAMDSISTLLYPPQVEDLAFFDANRGYIATSDGSSKYSGDIFSTTDGGQNWKKDTLAWRESQPKKVQVLNGTTGFVLSPGNGGMLGADPRILATTNNGATWDTLMIPTTASVDDPWDFHFISQDSGWVTMTTRRILQTTDGGQTWFQQDSLDGYLTAITFSGNRGYVGTTDGRIFSIGNPVSITPSKDRIPLIKTWPGPFRETLNLEITQALTAIRIYDLTGKTKWMQSSLSPGRHAISTKDFAPGIYFLKAVPADSNSTTLFVQKIVKQ